MTLPLPGDNAVLEVVVDLPWIPKLALDGSEDTRELGIGVQDVALRSDPAEAPEPRPRAW